MAAASVIEGLVRGLGLYERFLLPAFVMWSRGKVIQRSQADGAVQGDADFEQSPPIKTPQRLQPASKFKPREAKVLLHASEQHLYFLS